MDYKEMYLRVMSATEAAIDLLIQAQREAEELYLAATDADQIASID